MTEEKKTCGLDWKTQPYFKRVVSDLPQGIDPMTGAVVEMMQKTRGMIEEAAREYVKRLPWYRRIWWRCHVRKNLVLECWPDGSYSLKTRKGKLLVYVTRWITVDEGGHTVMRQKALYNKT